MTGVTMTCEHCHRPKALNAFAIWAEEFDRADNGRRLSVTRDPICRQCRGAMGRGGDRDLIRARERERQLEQQLLRVRAKIRLLLEPQVLHNVS